MAAQDGLRSQGTQSQTLDETEVNGDTSYLGSQTWYKLCYVVKIYIFYLNNIISSSSSPPIDEPGSGTSSRCSSIQPTQKKKRRYRGDDEEDVVLRHLTRLDER